MPQCCHIKSDNLGGKKRVRLLKKQKHEKGALRKAFVQLIKLQLGKGSPPYSILNFIKG